MYAQFIWSIRRTGRSTGTHGCIGSSNWSVTPASGGPTRFVKTLKQCHVSELDSLPRQAQSFQLDTHEDKRSRIWITREEKKKNPTCNASGKHKWRWRIQAPSGAHKSREETEKKDERRKHHAVRTHKINAARPASNQHTLTEGMCLNANETRQNTAKRK